MWGKRGSDQNQNNKKEEMSCQGMSVVHEDTVGPRQGPGLIRKVRAHCTSFLKGPHTLQRQEGTLCRRQPFVGSVVNLKPAPTPRLYPPPSWHTFQVF